MKYISIPSVILGLLVSSFAFGNQVFTQKTIDGYKVQCFSEGDLELAGNPDHKPTNLCSPAVVKTILHEARKIESPNFAGDLKLIKYTPNKKNDRLFVDYAMVIIVDEKEKRITPSTYTYGISKIDDTGRKVAGKYKLGKLYSSPDSFLYTFENNSLPENLVVEVNRAEADTYVYSGGDVIGGVFQGYASSVGAYFYAPLHMLSSTREYFSIVNKSYPESNAEYRKTPPDFRTVKQVFAKHKVVD